MKILARWLLAASLIANLALGLAYFGRSPARPADAAAWTPREEPKPAPQEAPPDASAAGAPARVLPLRWDAVESDDYSQFIGNLRQMGCPEPTIRDIVAAEINGRFEPEFQDLLRASQDFEYWRVGPGHPETRALILGRLEELEGRRQAILASLLGEEYFPRRPLYWRTLPELAEQGRFAMLPEDLRAALPGMDPAQRRLLLEQSLPSEDLFEHQVRYSARSDQLRARLAGLEASEEEFRQLFQLEESLSGPMSPGPEDDAEAMIGSLAETREDGYRKVLGEERYRDMARRHDPFWQALKGHAQETEMNPRTREEVWSLKQEFGTLLTETMADQELSGEERWAFMEIARAQLSSQIDELAGEGAARRLEAYLPSPAWSPADPPPFPLDGGMPWNMIFQLPPGPQSGSFVLPDPLDAQTVVREIESPEGGRQILLVPSLPGPGG